MPDDLNDPDLAEAEALRTLRAVWEIAVDDRYSAVARCAACQAELAHWRAGRRGCGSMTADLPASLVDDMRKPERPTPKIAPDLAEAEGAALRALREVIDADRHPPFRDPAARIAAASAILAHARAVRGEGR